MNVTDAEAEPVIGPLKIEMLPPKSPTATLPAESTATAETSLAVVSDRVAVGVGVEAGEGQRELKSVAGCAGDIQMLRSQVAALALLDLVEPPHATRHAMKAAANRAKRQARRTAQKSFAIDQGIWDRDSYAQAWSYFC